VTAALGFKRFGFAVLAVFAIGICMLALSSVLISTDSARESVKNQIRTITGLEPLLRGPVSVSLFPIGAVNFADVVLGDGRTDEPALTAERLTSHLRLWPLLVGRVEISDVALIRPRIAIKFAPDGSSNWSALLDALARAQKPNAAAADQVSFSEIRIDRGTIVISDATHGFTETLRDAELSLAWPSISQSFAATGHFVWHDKPVEGSMSLSNFLAALTGERSGLKFRVAGELLKVAFDGTMSSQPTTKIEGTLAADAASLRDVFRWTGQKELPGGGLEHFALKAKTTLVAGTIELSGVNVELDGNTAEGVLTYAFDGRRTLQGTLAVDTLNLAPYVSTVRLIATNTRDWDRMPISVDGFTNFDLDVRLSAARVSIGATKLGHTAIQSNLRSGQLDVTIIDAEAFGGDITGSFGVAKSELGVDLKAHMLFKDVDLEACLSELFAMHHLEGKGVLALDIEGAGDSIMGLTRRLNGKTTLTATNGALAGFDVEQLLHQLDRRPLSGIGELRGGRTPFDTLTASLKVTNGTATLDAFQIQGPTVRLALGGSASIPGRELDLKGTAGLLPTADASASVFELPFVVRGTWDDFQIRPDPQTLMNRSKATLPLLGGRKMEDAIRSSIDRWTGGVSNTIPPVAPTPTATEPQSDTVPRAGN
jgi:AsmA protein